MEKRFVELDMLQPTDALREEEIKCLAGLTFRDIQSILPLPQVWDLGDYQILTDGNNRMAVLSRKGVRYAKAQVLDVQTAERYCFPIEEELKRAERLRAQGVYSLGDLWKLANSKTPLQKYNH